MVRCVESWIKEKLTEKDRLCILFVAVEAQTVGQVPVVKGGSRNDEGGVTL